MISISGIKYQKELETLPFFSKQSASILIGKESKNLDKKLAQLTRIGYLKTLKKGVYVTSAYIDTVDKEPYFEYLANILRAPSYISAEYVLAKEGLIPESVFCVTSITTKSSRNYSNKVGSFNYRSIKASLFVGYKEKEWQGNIIYIATKAKALFDYFYFKRFKNFDQDIYDFRINWNNFTKKDLIEFNKYVNLTQGPKMSKVLKHIAKLC